MNIEEVVMATESFKRNIIIDDKDTIDMINEEMSKECSGKFEMLVDIPEKSEEEREEFLKRVVDNHGKIK